MRCCSRNCWLMVFGAAVLTVGGPVALAAVGNADLATGGLAAVGRAALAVGGPTALGAVSGGVGSHAAVSW